MAILVGCSGCGKRFHAKDEIRNRRIPCPNCKSVVVVQGPHVCGTDVFISHSSVDKQVADAVCAALESKGVKCWIAPRDIPAGSSWGASIVEAIEDSRVMLLVFSAHANKSDQVMREVERAVAKKKPVVPLRIDAESMRKDFEYFLASCHWVDATSGTLESHLDGLTKRVRRLLLDTAEDEVDAKSGGGGGSAAPRATSPIGGDPPALLLQETPPAARRSHAKPLALAAAVALVLAALGVFYVKQNSAGGTDASAASAGASPQPTTAAPTTSPASPKIDLLAGVVLPRDVISGTWTKTDAGLEGSGDFPLRLRFTNPPEGDYDVRVEFTPTFGLQGVAIILTRNGKSFTYSMGMYHGPAFTFERRNKVSRVVGVVGRASLTNNERHRVVLKVRKNSVDATFDGDPAGQLLTNYNDMDVIPAWRIGPNVLGLASSRNIVLHSAECVAAAAPTAD
jgi:hypothetical protein